MDKNDSNEVKDIKIPIKDIVSKSMHKNGANYNIDNFNLLRCYFIACLNLGFLEPNDLEIMVDKFTEQIKSISDCNHNNKMDYYYINNSKLHIYKHLKYDKPELYQINFYKAVSEVIFKSNDEHIGISNALSAMAAEKIYNMDAKNSRIVMPKTDSEQIGEKEIQIRAGYQQYNLTISLLKQFFICKRINENKVIKNMFFDGYENTIKEIFNDETNNLLMNLLDQLCVLYINRKIHNLVDDKEILLLEKYQVLLNYLFEDIDQNYFAFCALITDDELRIKCMSKFETEE